MGLKDWVETILKNHYGHLHWDVSTLKYIRVSFRLMHPDGRIFNSDWFVNNCCVWEFFNSVRIWCPKIIEQLYRFLTFFHPAGKEFYIGCLSKTIVRWTTNSDWTRFFFKDNHCKIIFEPDSLLITNNTDCGPSCPFQLAGRGGYGSTVHGLRVSSRVDWPPSPAPWTT